jgi:hypothetical protein
MALREEILGAVAKSLVEFGYPDARADNILTTKIFAMFARSQLEDFLDGQKNPEVIAVVNPMLDQIAETTGEVR